MSPEKWHGRHIPREVRVKAIMSREPEALAGFLFESPGDAFLASKKILEGNKKVLFADIDDNIFHSEPWLRSKINQLIINSDRSFAPVTIDEVKATPLGRYWQIARYQEAASRMGLKFIDLFMKVQNDEELHATMMPVPDKVDVIDEFQKEGFVMAGYPTARPATLSRVTASALEYYGFPRSPVVDVNADSGKPANAKVEFFRNILQGIETDDKKIIFMDDDIDTVIAVKKAFPQLICIATKVLRNDNRENQELDELGIIYRSAREIIDLVKTL